MFGVRWADFILKVRKLVNFVLGPFSNFFGAFLTTTFGITAVQQLRSQVARPRGFNLFLLLILWWKGEGLVEIIKCALEVLWCADFRLGLGFRLWLHIIIVFKSIVRVTKEILFSMQVVYLLKEALARPLRLRLHVLSRTALLLSVLLFTFENLGKLCLEP